MKHVLWVGTIMQVLPRVQKWNSFSSFILKGNSFLQQRRLAAESMLRKQRTVCVKLSQRVDVFLIQDIEHYLFRNLECIRQWYHWLLEIRNTRIFWFPMKMGGHDTWVHERRVRRRMNGEWTESAQLERRNGTYQRRRWRWRRIQARWDPPPPHRWCKAA